MPKNHRTTKTKLLVGSLHDNIRLNNTVGIGPNRAKLTLSQQILQNEADVAEQAKKALKITCAARGQVQENGPPKVQFQGYSGDEVDLRDYGFDHPVVYNIAGIKMKQKVPILYNHYRAIGHTVEMKKPGNEKLVGRGLLSLPNDKTNEIAEGLKNEFPFEGSMGLTVGDWEKDITFYKKGEQVKVNNRIFEGPKYVVEESTLIEMTLTEFGRDSNTSFEFLNEAQRMTLKNSKLRSTLQNSGTSGGTATENQGEENKGGENKGGENKGGENKGGVQNSSTMVVLTQEQFQQLLANRLGGTGTQNSNTGQEEEEAEGEEQNRLKNSEKSLLRIHKLCREYPDHLDTVEKAVEEGWSDEQLKNAIKLERLDNGLAPLPQGGKEEKGDVMKNMVQARLGMYLGLKPETIEAKFGKEIANQANDAPVISISEVLVCVANSCGGNFNSWSDMDAVCRHIKNFNKLNNSIGFSTLTYTNLLEGVARMQLEERWKLDPPFAPRMLDEGSNKDFRKTKKVRVSGGDPWERLEPDGTIKHTSFGPEQYYETELDTVAALFTWDRKTIINDDQDVTRQLMDAMVEGALMVPDIKLGQLMLVQAAAAGTFWVNADNSITGTALTRANLSTVYKDLLTYDEQRGTIAWKNIVNGKFTLILDPAMEETAFDIFKQDWVVNNPAATGVVGSRNFWFNKFDMAFFPQMSNTALFGSGTFVSPNTWIIWPQNKKYSPYIITYLKGRKKPTLEAIDLPDNILGAGVRGYWDVEVNERERQFIRRVNG